MTSTSRDHSISVTDELLGGGGGLLVLIGCSVVDCCLKPNIVG